MLKKFGILVLIITILGCQTRSGGFGISDKPLPVATMVLLPHHLLVEKNIHAVYELVAKSRAETDYKVERVFILSPDHFAYGASKVQLVSELGQFPIAKNTINKLSEFQLPLDAKNSTLEHGLTVHTSIAQNYFPEVQFVPIRLKNETSIQILSRLLAGLQKNFNPQTDLMIASIDFAHYVSDDYAVPNDQKIIKLLESDTNDLVELLAASKKLAASPDPNEPLGVGIDSPESLAVLLAMRSKLGSDFEINTLERTSTKTVTGIDVSKDNTSHLYAIWYGKLEPESR